MEISLAKFMGVAGSVSHLSKEEAVTRAVIITVAEW
jgi:hypothetical protein